MMKLSSEEQLISSDFIKSSYSQSWGGGGVCTEQRGLLIRRLSISWEKWIATSLAGQNKTYTSLVFFDMGYN